MSFIQYHFQDGTAPRVRRRSHLNPKRSCSKVGTEHCPHRERREVHSGKLRQRHVRQVPRESRSCTGKSGLRSVPTHKLILWVQLVLGNDWDSCMASLKTNEKPFGLHLIEHTNLEFVVRSTIAPTAMNLTRFKVSGRLPALVVNFSNLKYKSLMGLIDISIPKYEDDGATTLVSLPTARPLTPHLSPRLSPAADYTIIEGHGHSTSGNENQSEQREDTMPLDVESADKDVSCRT